MPLGVFSKKPQIVLGVDIGTSSIKIAEITRTGNSITLSNYGQAYGPSKNQGEIAERVKEVLAGAHVVSRNAVAGVPVFSSFSTIIDLPRMSDAELQQAVPQEARKYIPIPLAEVQLDWAIVPPLSTKSRMNVLAVAVPNDVIGQYTAHMKRAGLMMRELELETFALARSLAGVNPDTILLVDIGFRSTNIAISQGGVVPVHHTIDTSGASFTQALVRGMNVDEERSEDLKRSEGLGGEAQVRELLVSAVQPIMLEISRVIQDYEQKGGKKPSSVLLAGGSARLPGLSHHMSRYLSLPVHMGNPFRSLSYPRELAAIAEDIGPSFAVALGLALRKL